MKLFLPYNRSWRWGVRICVLLSIVLWSVDCSPNSSKLYAMAMRGDTVGVQRLVNTGMNLDKRSMGHGWNALQVASSSGHIGVVRVLLDGGADPDYEGAGGVTALGVAAANGRVFVIDELLQHCADINHQSKDGRTPLHGAAQYGFIEAVKLLVEHGADVTIRDDRGRTPLDLAIEGKYYKYKEVVAFLSGKE